MFISNRPAEDQDSAGLSVAKISNRKERQLMYTDRENGTTGSIWQGREKKTVMKEIVLSLVGMVVFALWELVKRECGSLGKWD